MKKKKRKREVEREGEKKVEWENNAIAIGRERERETHTERDRKSKKDQLDCVNVFFQIWVKHEHLNLVKYILTSFNNVWLQKKIIFRCHKTRKQTIE
jgi:hypothetical protein